MNVERVNAIARRLKADLDATQLVAKVQALADSVAVSVAQPPSPETQQAIAAARSEAANAISASALDHLPPVEQEAIAEWEIDGVLGSALQSRLDEILRDNQLTPATAAEQLAELATRLQELSGVVDSLVAAFNWLGIASEELDPGQFEVDVLIPRQAVHEHLGELGREFVELERIFLPFIELTTGSRPAVEVRSIASSQFAVYLATGATSALAIAKAVDQLLGIYERIINIRKAKAEVDALRGELNDEVVDKAIEPLEEQAEAVLNDGIDDLAAELTREFAASVLPPGRENELQVEITHSLRSIAGRIDHGYNVSVRTSVLPAPGEDEEESEEDARVRAASQEVESRRERMQFMNRTGESILELTDGESQVDLH